MQPEPVMRVLVVDDDSFLVSLLTRMLKTAGVQEVAVASDGRAALISIQAQMPQLVLCDLNMPGMDGLEFLRHLAGFSPAPMLALMSGADRRVLNTARQLAQAHGLNVTGILGKPVAPPELRDVLQRIVPATMRGSSRIIDPLTRWQIEDGIAAGCVRAYYQPKVSAVDGSVRGVEALLRWHDPQRGLIPPVAVVPVAENGGLMHGLTMAMFRAVLADMPRLLAARPTLTVAVNVSVENLLDLCFAEQILELLQRAGVNPSALMIEVTESRLMENVTRPAEILTRLRLKGIGLSVDDYGTGASTLQQLQRVPATELKIDRVFVNGACNDPDALAMLESSAHLARRLGLTVVAEGVESEEELDLVRRAGCDLVQGFYIQRPLALDSLLDWMGRQ